MERARSVAVNAGVSLISSPFSEAAVDILEEIDIPFYKVPSGEVTNIPLLMKISQTGKPVLLSSGMSNWSEIDAAVDVFKGKNELIVMQCTSMYPCPDEEVGLAALPIMKQRYECEVGFSDHTFGYAAPISAAFIGATIIEKHFTFSRLMYGSDAKLPWSPQSFDYYPKKSDLLGRWLNRN